MKYVINLLSIKGVVNKSILAPIKTVIKDKTIVFVILYWCGLKVLKSLLNQKLSSI